MLERSNGVRRLKYERMRCQAVNMPASLPCDKYLNRFDRHHQWRCPLAICAINISYFHLGSSEKIAFRHESMFARNEMKWKQREISQLWSTHAFSTLLVVRYTCATHAFSMNWPILYEVRLCYFALISTLKYSRIPFVWSGFRFCSSFAIAMRHTCVTHAFSVCSPTLDNVVL